MKVDRWRVGKKLWKASNDFPKIACTSKLREENVSVACSNCSCYNSNKQIPKLPLN